MMEIIARHPAGEKAAAGSSQDSPYTRYQAVNSVSAADDTVAPPTVVWDEQQHSLDMLGKAWEHFSLKTELVPELRREIHAQVSEKQTNKKQQPKKPKQQEEEGSSCWADL